MTWCSSLASSSLSSAAEPKGVCLYQLEHRSSAQDALLDAAVERAAALGDGAVAVFDLDGCLFDNRPRQVQILRIWGARNDVVELGALQVEHIQSWSMTDTLVRMGLHRERAAEIAQRARPFWERWFFDDAYVSHDRVLPGAPRFVRRIASTRARVIYLTGRLSSQRPSTLLNLRRHGFPVDDAGSCLVTKADPEQGDRAFKREAFERIAELGEVVVSFDNEPGHVNHAHRRFPGAVVAWLATDHSPAAEPVLAELPGIHGFLRTTDPELRASRDRS